MTAEAILDEWLAQWGPIPADPEIAITDERSASILADLAGRLTDNYPFPHPVYAGQMLKPPHPMAAAAYALAMTINPNNHALDGGPATAALERECIAALATMVGYEPSATLGHLTSSGTIANLEALWIARELHPGKVIASSATAHYTHGRMCGVLGVRHLTIPCTADGRMSVGALEDHLQTGEICTIVATLGTTALGAVDDLPAILALARRYGVRVHVDAAYGGFFRLLAGVGCLGRADAAFLAMAEADSIVIDPHKHGLQPYGCGSVLFRDAGVGRFYKHDSPYTYFTSDELHLGEISLECSRAGAAAAAFWATLQAFPLTPDGLGSLLKRTRQAALQMAELIDQSQTLHLLCAPELDIVCFLPLTNGPMAMTTISAWTERIFAAGMRPDADAFYLAKLTVERDQLPDHIRERVQVDAPTTTILRSVLMKPEHALIAGQLFKRIEAAAIATAP